jgi:hypothetical protein
MEGWKDGRMEGWTDGGAICISHCFCKNSSCGSCRDRLLFPLRSVHASQAATAMGVAYGEQVADMIQPFWALPLVAVAGISIRRVMGFTVMSFLLGVVLFGTALLIFV